ncbi:MAG: DUF2116 family Zn-ribbon domain-containing protein [Lachnospiraceae bacterium]|nr:DUF2116 family Zn-ribbon domain-containing protein [Lachnospiraceae bacterium]
MICPKCKATIDDDALFCEICGAKLKKKKKRKKFFKIVAGVLLVLAVLNFLSQRFSGYEDKIENMAAQTEETNEKVTEEEAAVQTEAIVQKESAAVRKRNRGIIVVDPAHQSCSFPQEKEAVGPGSAETKHKYSSSEIGAYTYQDEAELCLEVAKLLKDKLTENGYQVILTRENNDTLIGNQERAQMTEEYSADIFIRINANFDEDGQKNGADVLIPSRDNAFVGGMYNQCRNLAENILEGYCEATGFVNNGCKETDHNTGMNWSTCPVMLIELGYLSNQYNDEAMVKGSFRDRMAEGIYRGIESYMSQE